MSYDLEVRWHQPKAASIQPQGMQSCSRGEVQSSILHGNTGGIYKAILVDLSLDVNLVELEAQSMLLSPC